MRRSEFLRALEGEFGVRAPAILQDLYLSAVGGTARDALDAGVDPRAIWSALCDEQDVPESRRHGAGRIDRARS